MPSTTVKHARTHTAFNYSLPPNAWGQVSHPPGCEWSDALFPGPINGGMYRPGPDEIVYVSPWAGIDAYEPYQDGHLVAGHVQYRHKRTFRDQPPPLLFLVRNFEPPVGVSEFAWLTGWRCSPALRMPEDGDMRRIFVRMTEVTSVRDAEEMELLASTSG